jgi:hypothetical protein
MTEGRTCLGNASAKEAWEMEGIGKGRALAIRTTEGGQSIL